MGTVIILLLCPNIGSHSVTFVPQALFPAPAFVDFHGRERERVRDVDRPPVYRQVFITTYKNTFSLMTILTFSRPVKARISFHTEIKRCILESDTVLR